MTVGWEDFSDARGEDGLVHLVQKGEAKSLCGKEVQAVVVQGERACPLCRSLRRERINPSTE